MNVSGGAGMEHNTRFSNYIPLGPGLMGTTNTFHIVIFDEVISQTRKMGPANSRNQIGPLFSVYHHVNKHIFITSR